jgi:hypothetical protein
MTLVSGYIHVYSICNTLYTENLNIYYIVNQKLIFLDEILLYTNDTGGCALPVYTLNNKCNFCTLERLCADANDPKSAENISSKKVAS